MGSNSILPVENSLAVLTREISRMLSRALEKQIKDYGVTITQYYYLRVLWDEDGLSQQELSGRVGTKAPSTAITLRGMEKAGYIRRIRNNRDGRIVNTML
ncbi:MAG: MarR family transcriptional regulator, partial [Gammaproteobacteria bacterium]